MVSVRRASAGAAVRPFQVLLLLLLLPAGLAGCAGTSSGPPPAPVAPPVADPVPDESPSPLADRLDAYLAQPADVRSERREQARRDMAELDRFRYEVDAAQDAGRRHWFWRGTDLELVTLGVGLGNGIRSLHAACRADPTCTEAWLELGQLTAGAGDLVNARRILDDARASLRVRDEAGDPVDREVRREVFRQRAWVLRDLGYWDEGLAAADEGLREFPGDRDLVLIRGLLLAGAGRYTEATRLAVRMEPFTYPQLDVFHYGTRDQTSDFANRWIRSQALLAVGEFAQARHVLGEMNSYPYRWYLPHQKRFWNDVGLAAELAGDPEADTWYALSVVVDRYRGFYPLGAANREPMVHGVPDRDIPYFTSFGDRFLVAGSVLSYAAGQMTRMSLAAFGPERDRAAWRAKEALDMAERRHIRPDVVRALRGRLAFSRDDRPAAREDLEAAVAAFRAEGRPDAGTSLLLGLLDMDDERYGDAAVLLREAAHADPASATAWRSLGVCLVREGETAEAADAMDRALALEPRSVTGLYNRGLLHLQQREFLPAGTCLERALRLEPGNREVQRLLQLAASNVRAGGGDPAEIRRLAAADDTLRGADRRDAILAGLQDDLDAFFSVPDSLRATMAADDSVITALRARYAATGETALRPVLALACIDRGLNAEAQTILAPGWGVDLSPEEEIMLLHVDRVLGEKERARDLADRLTRGEAEPTNGYLLMMLLDQDRRNWRETFAGNHYPESYSAAATMSSPDHERFSRYMRHGFANLRTYGMAADLSAMFPLHTPFFRSVMGIGDGVGSPTSGNAARGGQRAGNAVK